MALAVTDIGVNVCQQHARHGRRAKCLWVRFAPYKLLNLALGFGRVDAAWKEALGAYSSHHIRISLKFCNWYYFEFMLASSVRMRDYTLLSRVTPPHLCHASLRLCGRCCHSSQRFNCCCWGCNRFSEDVRLSRWMTVNARLRPAAADRFTPTRSRNHVYPAHAQYTSRQIATSLACVYYAVPAFLPRCRTASQPCSFNSF